MRLFPWINFILDDLNAGLSIDGMEYVVGPFDKHISFRRGFSAKITCTWADWQANHERWWWGPGHTVECQECKGNMERPWRVEDRKRFNDQARIDLRKRQTRLERGESDSVFEHRVLVEGGRRHEEWRASCVCRGSGRVPRPFPTGERECPTCGPRNRMAARLGRPPAIHCSTCGTTGRVPSEPMVMPLTTVRIVGDAPNERESGTIKSMDWATNTVEYYAWPGLRFVLPQEAEGSRR